MCRATERGHDVSPGPGFRTVPIDPETSGDLRTPILFSTQETAPEQSHIDGTPAGNETIQAPAGNSSVADAYLSDVRPGGVFPDYEAFCAAAG